MNQNFILSTLLCVFAFATSAHASTPAFEATKKIAGKYTGTWTMYSFANDTVIQKAAWTDVLTADTPTEEKDRAFVQVSDVMTFADGTTRTTKFTEGYFSNPDGTIGDRFYDYSGATTLFKKLTENDWTYQSTPSDFELRTLGFDPKTVISASHVATKTTTYEGPIDTDHVTRVTTIQWKDKTGTTKSIQFTSLTGTHTRQLK